MVGNGDSERMPLVYWSRTVGVLQGQGVHEIAHCARNALGPTPPGPQSAANVPEEAGQGETWHILHQRCVGCEEQRRSGGQQAKAVSFIDSGSKAVQDQCSSPSGA